MRVIIFLLVIIGVSSCGSWSKRDKDTFIESCQKTKFNDEFCNCALEKALENYNTFDDMTADEENMAELLLSCIEEDRKKEE